MSAPNPPPHSEIREEHESLWLLTFSPGIWAIHFLASYITAAVWCAKVAGRDGSLRTARIVIAIYTLLALVGIALVAWKAYRRHSFGHATVPHDFDTPEDRHRFLGFATLLLSALSAAAVVYVAMAAIFIWSCH